jgi:hypothetical protein
VIFLLELPPDPPGVLPGGRIVEELPSGRVAHSKLHAAPTLPRLASSHYLRYCLPQEASMADACLCTRSCRGVCPKDGGAGAA